MFKHFLLFTAFALGSAFGEQSGAALNATIHIDRGTHRAAIAPGLETPMSGDRGCPSQNRTDCQSFEHIMEVTGVAAEGDRLIPVIDGEGVADRITFTRNGVEFFAQDKVALPFEIAGNFEARPGDVFQITAIQGDAMSVTTVKTGERAASPTNYDNQVTLRIRYFVPYRGGLAEVVTNSGTGGKFVSRSAFCAKPGVSVSACPANRTVRYYTDRASRGETLYTLLSDYRHSGTALVFLVISDKLRAGPVGVAVPQADLMWQVVSMNPQDDNMIIYALFDNYANSRRIPVGTR